MPITLSDDQLRAVNSSRAATVVVASAGCGKTEVLAQRVERFLRGTDPDGYRVLALTYTVKAGDELKDRLRIRLGDLSRRVDADTMHGFALTLLRRYGSRLGLPPEPEIVTKVEDRAELLSDWLVEAGFAPPDDPQKLLEELDLARAQRRETQYVDAWRDALASRGALDYPAMLDQATDLASGSWLGRQLRALYGEVVIDEAQNLTNAQYALLTMVIGDPSGPHIDTMLVGDERQSIVGFAGADSRLIRRFEREYSAERIELTTNFRSAGLIVNVGHEVARKLRLAPTTPMQHYQARGKVELKDFPSEEEEGEHLALWVKELLTRGADPSALTPGESTHLRVQDIAILARSAAALRFPQAALHTHGIETALTVSEEEWVRSPAARLAFEIIAHRAAPNHLSVRRQIASLCGMDGPWTDLQSTVAGASDLSVRSLKSLCDVDDVGDVLPTLRRLDIEDLDWPDDLAQLDGAWQTFVDRFGPADRTFANFRQHIIRSQRGDSLPNGVRLLTVHRAQGREFKAVAIAACNEGQFPDFRATSHEDRAAELRIFYVAVTRPSRILLLTRARSRSTRFGRRPTEPSSFWSLARRGLSREGAA